MALLDLAGKHQQLPLHQLLPFATQTPRAYSGVVPYLRGEKLERVLRIIQSLALPQVKIKVGQGEEESQLAKARAILGDAVDLRVDANQAWTLAEAIEKIHRLKKYGISAVEEPLHRGLKSDLPRLAAAIDLPIILDESVCSLADAKYFADCLPAERLIFNIKIAKLGGLSRAAALHRFARSRGIACMLGCHVGETGILSAAGRWFAHTHELRYVEGAYAAFFMESNLCTESLCFGAGGKAELLPQAGLGIQLVPELLEKYTVRKMLLALENRTTKKKPKADMMVCLRDFKVTYNKISISRLLKKYESIGFLYPAKKRLLDPYFPQIKDNWKKLKASPDRLLWILNKEDQVKDHFSSVSVVKYYNRGVIAQHLVSNGNPFLSLELMQAAQYVVANCFDGTEINSSQNWFRPDNRYAYRIFASVVKKLGKSQATLSLFHYLQINLHTLNCQSNDAVQIEDLAKADAPLNQFLADQMGEAFVIGEELDSADLRQENISAQFQKVGLRRTRRVLKIVDRASQSVIGGIIVNRAPLGLNFSFLGNRCLLILDKNLNPQQRKHILPSILQSIKPHYQDFALGVLPLLTDAASSTVLQSLGAQYLREYLQCIWLRAGFQDWYAHIQSFLQAIEARRHRKASKARGPNQPRPN